MNTPRTPPVVFNLPKNGAQKKQKKKQKGHVSTIGGQRFSVANLGPAGGYTYGVNGSTELTLEKTEDFIVVSTSATASAFNAISSCWHPGSADLAWLRNMSNSFTSYELLALEFTYVPAVPTTTAGAVSLGFYEDIIDSIPTTMGQMLVNEQAMYAPVYAGSDGGTFLQRFGNPGGNVLSFNIPKRCTHDERGTPRRFRIAKSTTFDALIAGTNSEKISAQSYSPGRFVVATEGAAASITVGHIFVRYRVKLTGAISLTNQV
jgi:hypothetical protein